MAQQLDLFNASRTTSYRNQHRVIQRRLKTTGSGDRKIKRMTNRITGGQSMRANGNRLNQALTSARRSVRSVKLILRRSGIKVKRSSFGSKGG
ncbi:hypothetical protein [Lactobacillus taiwanensis]|uniref:hypothetical protein n=1 Tax=Lactobacillus taiwanensis TaxID=508451 RepID=UPI002431FE2E|nr:hypothetical protein [Lactobacillus taiwanensis]